MMDDNTLLILLVCLCGLIALAVVVGVMVR